MHLSAWLRWEVLCSHIHIVNIYILFNTMFVKHKIAALFPKCIQSETCWHVHDREDGERWKRLVLQSQNHWTAIDEYVHTKISTSVFSYSVTLERTRPASKPQRMHMHPGFFYGVCEVKWMLYFWANEKYDNKRERAYAMHLKRKT